MLKDILEIMSEYREETSIDIYDVSMRKVMKNGVKKFFFNTFENLSVDKRISCKGKLD